MRSGERDEPEFDDKALDALEVVIPNLNWRYSGGTAVNRTIAPLIAKRWRAAWFGPDRPEGIAGLEPRATRAPALPSASARQGPHLACAPQCRDARRAFPEPDRLSLRADFQFGLPAQKDLAHRLSHRADGRGDRDQRDRGAISAASGDGHPSRHRRRSLFPARRPPRRLRRNRPAGKYGIGTFGRVRKQKGSDLFVEAMRRLLPQYPISAPWWSGSRPSTICPLSKG